jgi:hypothetical protein
VKLDWPTRAELWTDDGIALAVILDRPQLATGPADGMPAPNIGRSHPDEPPPNPFELGWNPEGRPHEFAGGALLSSSSRKAVPSAGGFETGRDD